MEAAREQIVLPEGESFRVLRWGRSLSEVECVPASGTARTVPGEGTHWHFHTEMELTLFTAGQGTRFVGDHIATFGTGDLVLLGEKLPHYWHTSGRSSGISLQWHFPLSHPFWAFPESSRVSRLFQRASRGLHLSGRMAMAAKDSLQRLADVGTGQAPLTRLALLLDLLGRLAGGNEEESVQLSQRSFVEPAELRHQHAISEAVRHLVSHFREPVRMEDLLSLTGMSRPTFARQFKQHCGRSFGEFLNGLRLQAACQELRASQRSILEISLESGFSQVSFFNRLFRREMSCNPTEYRLSHCDAER